MLRKTKKKRESVDVLRSCSLAAWERIIKYIECRFEISDSHLSFLRKDFSFLEVFVFFLPLSYWPFPKRSNIGFQKVERNELLGDAVLNLLVTDFLTSRYPAANVAFLSDLKSKMISGSVLAELFRYEKMYSFFPIPFPEKLKLSDKVISGAFEAFLGTAYLLFGLDKVQDYLFVLLPEWEKTSWADPSVNYRSLLQTYLQALKKDFDYFYDFDSRKKKFVAKIVIDGKEVSLAWGKNKKEAGREAAKRLYTILVGKRKKGSNV